MNDIKEKDYTSKEIVWMETKEYEIRRYGKELRFYKKRSLPTRFGILALIASLLFCVAMVIDLGLPVPAELLPPLSMIFGVFGILNLLLAKLINKTFCVLTIDSKKNMITGLNEFLANFDNVHVEINQPSNRYAKSFLFVLKSDKKEISFYHTFVEKQRKELKQTLDDAGLKTEMISQFDLG